MNCGWGGRLTIPTLNWFCCTLTSTLGPIVAQVVDSGLSKHGKFFIVSAFGIQISEKLPLKRYSKFSESITAYLEQTQYPVNVEHISHLVLVFLLLNLNM